MSITYRIAGPVAALGLISVLVVALLVRAPIPTPESSHSIGVIAIALLLAACLSGVGLALAFARSLARDMERLPDDLRALTEHGTGGAEGEVAGETRADELGAMAREMRVFAAAMQEVTRSRAEMQRMALTDPLTGLPNRRGVLDFIAGAGSRDDWSRPGTIAVLHIDLDHFKAVNDARGHEAGDFVLREAARRMAGVVRESDLLARLGGDEFVIFANGIADQSALGRLAERVIRQFDAPVVHRDHEFNVSVSIGAALGGGQGGAPDPKRLLMNADTALCQAKADGRNRCAIYTARMALGLRQRQELAAEIRHGIARDEFRAWFRPVIDVRDGRTTALTVVPRWRHPARGLLSARDFLPTAEAHGLTEALAMPMLDQALGRFAEWRAAGLAVPTLHLGISRSMLLSAGIIDRVRWALDESGIEPARIAMQVSEKHCAGRGVELLFANLRRFAALGAGIVVDDFGAVNAALGTVTMLGATTIRVATGPASALLGEVADGRSGEDRRDALLRGFARIGESLGVKVQAKGVGSQAEMARLLAHGFTEMQGDALSPALDPAGTENWLAAAAVPVRREAG